MAPDTRKHRGLNACQKVLIHHALGLNFCPEYLAPGTVLRIQPSWLLSSEAAWRGMENIYDSLGRPSFYRKDRFWLAPDHIVDPRVNDQPRECRIIEACERIAKEMNLGDNYNPPNTTIMHTDFYRRRCQPGMLVIGCDSHTGSAGSLGALAIGMGVSDVIMQIVTGETYLAVPEVVCIRFVGKPPQGLSGKDVILGVLGQLKRNTVAAERLVEFTGEGLKYLSCDARFAIANMTTELGGIGALVVPDEVTAEYTAKRADKKDKSDSIYFRPDDDAEYAGEYEIDLSKLEHYVALYPSPDNVVLVPEAELPVLQGCFIGACTTTEEDLILGGLVLREGLRMGMRPTGKGLRRVTPGSLGITDRLKGMGLIQVYEDAGFVVGAPGCSYCVGMGVDKAGKGEVWLSSQNRNYRDRMGPGSIANIASAATVAASSFSMTLQSPQPLLDRINFDEFDKLREYTSKATSSLSQRIPYREPSPELNTSHSDETIPTLSDSSSEQSTSLPSLIRGRIQRIGNNIDTDSIIPTDKCINPSEDLARGAFCYTRPAFYSLAQSDATIVVAENAFGTGSSREQAPKALLAAGIKAVIAKSYAFIYARNQANNGLLGIKLEDESFYELAQENVELEIDVGNRVVRCCGEVFGFVLDPIEEKLLAAGGLLKVYNLYGTRLFKKLQEAAVSSDKTKRAANSISQEKADSKLEW